jgi:hypothetical protein
LKLRYLFASFSSFLVFAGTGISLGNVKEISDSALQDKAKEELRPANKQSPDPSPKDAGINKVVVPELWEDDTQSKLWRLGLSIQSFSISGKIGSSVGESFSLEALDSTSLVGLNLCRDFFSLGRNFKAGSCFDFQFATQSVNLETSSGAVYDNVSVNLFLPTLSGNLSMTPINPVPFHLSFMVGMAPSILVWNSRDQLVDGTDLAASYTLGFSSRFDVWRRVYIQGAYQFRDLILADSPQAIQSHNISATAGLLF